MTRDSQTDTAAAQQAAAQPTPASDQDTARVDADPAAAGSDTLEQALQATRAELDALKDQFLRAKAEAENVRRRADEETAKARKFAVESMAQELLPVKDSLEAALADSSGSIDALKTGVDLTLNQLRGAFERSRIQEVNPAVGERFDPTRHQAIASVPSQQAANTVVSVLQKGYLLAERTLRPALVTVAAAEQQAGAGS